MRPKGNKPETHKKVFFPTESCWLTNISQHESMGETYYTCVYNESDIADYRKWFVLSIRQIEFDPE